ncbi:MAG TPA: ABC transporter permease [Dehalococcoidia bacterium]|nr:ABC transporter permease [Dehalococcoidia bacterium]
MTLRDAFSVAIEALFANQLRAFLTMLGIIIGVGAVITLMAVGQGSQKVVEEGIFGLGSNLVYVRPGSTAQGGVQQGAGSAQTLSVEDAEAIQDSVPGVTAAAPETQVPLQVNAGAGNTFTLVKGVTPEYADVLDLQMAQGVFFTDEDMQTRSRTVVLGAAVAEQLFPEGNPLDQQVRLSLGNRINVNARVVGVLAAQGGDVSGSQDDQVLMPLTTVSTQVSVTRGAGNTSLVSQITVQVESGGQVDDAKDAITLLLQQRHTVAEPDFTVESQQDLADAANEANAALTVLLGAIAGISLVVGGIGIMNIMLVSVTERTREIGIRKAVGARKGDILLQFLTEALTVTVLGGLIGVGAGVGVAEFLQGRDIAGLGEDVQTTVSWSAVIAAFAISGAIGVFFGLYPASRAANLRPIEALRYE